MDAESGRVLLVEHRGRLQGTAAAQATIAGMLHPLDTQLRSSMAASSFQLAGHPVDAAYMLVEGETPGSVWLYGLANLLLLSVLGGAVIAIAKRHSFRTRTVERSNLRPPRTLEPSKSLYDPLNREGDSE
jgi:hypothetical protein